MNSFNHYLKHGAEIDQQVAQKLLGNAGLQLLIQDGKARLIRVGVPGNDALAAAHPFIPLEDLELPNIVREFLGAWAYRLAHPTFQAAKLRLDCGLFLQTPIPPEWILEIRTLPRL